jgi:hypothetical protein
MHFLRSEILTAVVRSNISLPSSQSKNKPSKSATYFTLVSCLTYSSNMKMEATYSSVMSVDFQRTARHCIPQERPLTLPVVIICDLEISMGNFGGVPWSCSTTFWAYTEVAIFRANECMGQKNASLSLHPASWLKLCACLFPWLPWWCAGDKWGCLLQRNSTIFLDQIYIL